MLAFVLFSALCFIGGNAVKIELQVDDKHELYVDGSLKSFGEHWSQLYTVTVTSADVLALYAENFNGPKGFIMAIDNEFTNHASWKCKPVNSINDIAGWSAKNFDDSQWGGAAALGNHWMWAAQGGQKCVCRLNLNPGGGSGSVELQVDDIHKLWDEDGKLLSEGSHWSQIYTAQASGSTLSLYAENFTGGYGVLMKINGNGVSPSQMRCKVVSGNLGQIDAENPGWRNSNFDDSTWGVAEKMKSSATNAKLQGTDIVWTPGPCGGKIICKIHA